jgi:hypothetical protein
MKPVYKYCLDARISGSKIVGRAGTIIPKNLIRKEDLVLKTLVFSLGADCFVLEPITINKPLVIKDSAPEGLIGKKIYGEAEDFSRPFKKVKITGGHTHLQTVLKDHALCIIDIPIKSHQNQS